MRGVGLVLDGLDLVVVEPLGLLLQLGLLLGQLVAEGEDLRHGEIRGWRKASSIAETISTDACSQISGGCRFPGFLTPLSHTGEFWDTILFFLISAIFNVMHWLGL